MIEAIGYGALAASSLVLGALLGLARPWSPRFVGVVLAFGAGALISAVSFELFEAGLEVGRPVSVGAGLAAGALTYFALDRAIDRRGAVAGKDEDGPALALGAFLDGIPEQLALGIGIAAGEGVSVGLLVAIFVSNLPEAIGSSTAMRKAGRSATVIARLWVLVAVMCALATVAGFGLADSVGGEWRAAINGFAAGALLTMLGDSMIPAAYRQVGRPAGLVLTLGFAVAAGLSLGG